MAKDCCQNVMVYPSVSGNSLKRNALFRVFLCGICATFLVLALPGCGEEDKAPETKNTEELVQENYKQRERILALQGELDKLQNDLERAEARVGEAEARFGVEKTSTLFIHVAILVVAVVAALLIGAGWGAKTRDAANQKRKEASENVSCETKTP